jgi:tRNA-Thr(GGU) m(6)t(6)A37 methyltransferase TsaA
MGQEQIRLAPIGRVESQLDDLPAAPQQGDEGAPYAWLVLEAEVAGGLGGIGAGDDILVFTWLDRARRDLLAVHPRGDASRPLQGVFANRSPDRPNPIGLHRVRVAPVDRNRLLVEGLEALDATPILDLEPVLSAEVDER